MVTVGIASGDTISSAQLVAALEQTGIVRSIKEWVIPGARIPDTADALPDVVFLDLGRDAESFFTFGAQLRRIRPTTKLIAVSATSPPTHQLLLDAMRGGVQDFLPKPVVMEVLKEMLSQLTEESAAHERPSLDKLIVVMGSKGGVGATTVAVNLGVQLSVFARKRVALLDFARPLGNAHLLLDMHPQFNIRDAVDNLERLDGHFFAGLLTPHKTNLQVLAGATQPEEWQTIEVPPLERVVNVAQNGFDAVVLDMGSQFETAWGPILRTARMILIVAEANVPSLWTLQRRLVALTGLGVEPERAKIVLNRWHKGDEDVLRGVQKDIHRPVFACIPNDFRKASTSINLGTPLLENSQNNGLSLRYRQIASQIAGIGPDPVVKKSSLGGLFSFPTKSKSKR
jgi:pilus assembly protein CpaE